MSSSHKPTFLHRAQRRYLKLGFVFSLLLVITAFSIPLPSSNLIVCDFGDWEEEGLIILEPLNIERDQPKQIEKPRIRPQVTTKIRVVKTDPVPKMKAKTREVIALTSKTSNTGKFDKKLKKVRPTIIDHPHVRAQFPGGDRALLKFMQKHFRYLGEEDGTIYVQFVVTNSGLVTDIKIARGVNKKLDREAMRVVRKMPLWAPGLKDDKAVFTRLVLPIKLQEARR